ISAETRVYAASQFEAASDWKRGHATKDDVLAAVNANDHDIVDSLSPASYNGLSDRQYGDFGNRRGHIKSAVNIHFESVVGDDGCFSSPELLRQRYHDAGVALNRPVITYCGGGVG